MTDLPSAEREKPVGERLRQLSEETTLLVRQELELAKAELSQKGRAAGVGAGLLGGAGVTALVGLIALGTVRAGELKREVAEWKQVIG